MSTELEQFVRKMLCFENPVARGVQHVEPGCAWQFAQYQLIFELDAELDRVRG